MEKFKKLEKYRHRQGPYGSAIGDNFGLFFIPRTKYQLKVICSPLGEEEWDHVSVSTPRKTPTWEDMCLIKDLFFDEAETVIQFHPKKSEYVNNHPHCLHLWRSTKTEHELPDSILVGFK